jgi:LemA protein
MHFGLNPAQGRALPKAVMLYSPMFWIACAVLLFWAVGAYNRLVRLRSAAIQAFGGLDAHLVRLQAMLAECDAAHAGAQGALEEARRALQGASTQFGANLAVARSRPLQPAGAAALTTGRDVLDAAWGQLLRVREDEDGPAAVMTWRQRWEEHQAQSRVAVEQFNDAVAQYNAGIMQFPARLLAWIFGFTPAKAL